MNFQLVSKTVWTAITYRVSALVPTAPESTLYHLRTTSLFVIKPPLMKPAISTQCSKISVLLLVKLQTYTNPLLCSALMLTKEPNKLLKVYSLSKIFLPTLSILVILSSLNIVIDQRLTNLFLTSSKPNLLPSKLINLIMQEDLHILIQSWLHSHLLYVNRPFL